MSSSSLLEHGLNLFFLEGLKWPSMYPSIGKATHFRSNQRKQVKMMEEIVDLESVVNTRGFVHKSSFTPMLLF